MTEKISNIIWGDHTIALILITGIYFTVKTGFIQLRLRPLFGGKGENRLKAVTSALAASMGTGNITGCAAAIAAGGAGAIFWMWVSAFTGMAVAFCENKLGAEYGSPMLYMEKGAKSRGMALIYSTGCLMTAFLMGCMSQAGALSEAVREQLSLPLPLIGAVLGIICAAVIFSEKSASEGIMNAAEKAVPVMGILYAAGCILLIRANGCRITALMGEIVSSALSPAALMGGAAGVTVKKAVSVGLRRGVFSNEAGMGSSVLVHSEADFGSPESAGAWAALEVFLDTMVCCTLTAAAVISSPAYRNGEKLVITEIFGSALGKAGGIFSCLSVCLFAAASILGWCCYGEKCFFYLTKGRWGTAYKLLYVSAAALGACMPLSAVMNAADIVNGLVIFPNLAALIICGADRKTAFTNRRQG